MERIEIDANILNSDWPKRSWDFHGTPEQQADQILSMGGPDQAKNLTHFMTLPAAPAMPAAVKAALRAKGFRL